MTTRSIPLLNAAARHPMRRRLPPPILARNEDQDLKLFVLSFTAFFICFSAFFL